MLHKTAVKATFLQSHIITPSYYSEERLSYVPLPLTSPLPRDTHVVFTAGLTVPKINAVSHFPRVK